MLNRREADCMPNSSIAYELGPTLLRKAKWTPFELTLSWVEELVACDADIRHAALDANDFVEILRSAHALEASRDADSTMDMIVERFQPILASAFAAKKDRSSDAARGRR